MNYQGAKIFLAVMEHQSISAAAKALYITQPAVSAQLKTLEEELGIPLFRRQRGIRRITLTQEGAQFISVAKLWVQAEKELQRFKDDCSRTPFRIGAIRTVHDYLATPIMEKLQKALPHLDVQPYIIPDDELNVMYHPPQFDAAFRSYYVSYTRPEATQYCTRTLFFEDGFRILCPADTTLPDRTLSPADLDPAYQIRNAFPSETTVFWQQHFPDTIVPQYPLLRNMLDVSMYFDDPRCWALVHVSMAEYLLAQHPGELVARRVVPEPPSRVCNLVVSKSCTRPEIISTLLRCCREYLEERPYLTNLLPDTI